MQVKDVMTSHPVTATPQQSLRDVTEIMRRMDIGFVPVGEDDHLVGAVTDRDIVVKGMAAGKDAGSAVGELLSGDVLYCFDDQEVSDVVRNMGDNQIRRMPVVDRDKRLVGVVSLGDLSREGAAAAAGDALEHISE